MEDDEQLETGQRRAANMSMQRFPDGEFGRSLDVIQGVAFPRPAPVEPLPAPVAAEGQAMPSPAPMSPPPDFED